MIKAIIFDLDDTLYKEIDFVYSGFKEVCLYLSKINGIEFEVLYKNSIEILRKDGRGKVFDILCSNFGIKEDTQKLVSIYRNTNPEIKLYKDSIYLINKLRDNYKLGIITDGMASVQWNKIKALNLKDIIHKIIVTDDYGKDFWKPSVFPYLKISSSFSVLPEECIYIGDNPTKDFIGARKVGMNTVRIVRDYGDYINIKLSLEYEADYNIKNLCEIERVIQLIN